MDFVDQRATQRFEAEREIRIQRESEELVGRTLNLSLGGACIRAQLSTPPEVGERVHVSFQIPTLDEVIEAEAQVRWHNDTDGVIGIQFLTGFRAKATLALGQYLEMLATAGDRIPA